MTGVCRKCGLVFDSTEEDTNGPDVRCVACYRKEHGLPPHPDYPDPQDADLDGPDTDVILGDDPDEYLGIPD